MSESRKSTRTKVNQPPPEQPVRTSAPKRTLPPRVTQLGLDDLPMSQRSGVRPAPDLPPPPRISTQAQTEQARTSQPEPPRSTGQPTQPPRGQADLPPPPAISTQAQAAQLPRSTAPRGQADLPPPPPISSRAQAAQPRRSTQSNAAQPARSTAPRGQADLPPPPSISTQAQAAQPRRSTQSNAAQPARPAAPRGQADLPPQSISSQVQARRTTTTATRTKTAAPVLVLKRGLEEPEAVLSPLHVPTLEVHQRAYDRPIVVRAPSSSLPSGRPLSGQPWMMVVIAVVSLVVLTMLGMTPSRTILSSYTQLGGQPAAPAAAAPQLLQTPDGQHSVLGASTITPQQIDAVLKEYGSPAVGSGAIWTEMSQKYNINAAYALAFFIHESSAGTNPGWAGLKPDGSSTHNIGNIICAGYRTCYGRFRDYPGWREGIEDWYRLIAREYVEDRGVHTVEQIIPIYAPSFENNVPAYVKAVTDLILGWQQGSVR